MNYRMSMAYLMFSLAAVVAAGFGAFYAYRSLQESQQRPFLVMALYEIQGGEEVWYQDVRAQPNQVRHENGMIEYELPLKLINEGARPAAEATIWIRSSTPGVSMTAPGGTSHWQETEYATQEWLTCRVPMVYANSGMNCHGVKIRCKNAPASVELPWKVLCAEGLDTEGVLTVALP
jgi:hypothetical protein